MKKVKIDRIKQLLKARNANIMLSLTMLIPSRATSFVIYIIIEIFSFSYNNMLDAHSATEMNYFDLQANLTIGTIEWETLMDIHT